MWTISKTFRFSAAHALEHLPSTHKCHNLHGHNYKLTVYVKGDLKEQWVQDYRDIKAAVAPIVESLDHQNLNDIIMIPTTAENIAYWLWTRIRPSLPLLYRIDVSETDDTCCSYCPRP